MSFGLEHLVCFHVAVGVEQQGYHRAPKALALRNTRTRTLALGNTEPLALKICVSLKLQRGEGEGWQMTGTGADR